MGFLGLLFARGQPPSPVMRDRLGEVAPFIARGVSPIHSVQASARIVKGATAGAVLLRDGQSCSLPGLADHELVAAGSPVLDIARRTLVDGQVYRSFLWPAPAGSSPAASHVRVTVIAATDVPPFVLGALLVTPDADCLGLTPRELEVLGLVVEGCSNHQIATSLCVAPRTVAAHMEHLLSKLAAPTRTLAAIRAEREGCYVPPAPRD